MAAWAGLQEGRREQGGGGGINHDREFKDVVFEDVVFDNDILDIDVTMEAETAYNRVTQLLCFIKHHILKDHILELPRINQ